jgi:hypothetical protein
MAEYLERDAAGLEQREAGGEGVRRRHAGPVESGHADHRVGGRGVLHAASILNGRLDNGMEVRNHNYSHGESYGRNRTAEYRAFESAKRRCNNPKCPDYPEYGGRGIEVRFESYTHFLQTVGRKPSSDHSLDRKDVNGHYEPGNVRWATREEQGCNKRNNRVLTVDGISLPASEWARHSGTRESTIVMRHATYGFCDRCAVYLPPYERCEHRDK